MGPQTEGLLISLGGGLLWAAAFGFVFAVVLILLIRRRAPTPEKVANRSKGGESVAVQGIENHAARSIPAEKMAAVAPTETEAHDRGGSVLEEATSGPLEAAGIAFEEMHQDGATTVSAAEGTPQTEVDMAVLPPVAERIPALAPTEKREEMNPYNVCAALADRCTWRVTENKAMLQLTSHRCGVILPKKGNQLDVVAVVLLREDRPSVGPISVTKTRAKVE